MIGCDCLICRYPDSFAESVNRHLPYHERLKADPKRWEPILRAKAIGPLPDAEADAEPALPGLFAQARNFAKAVVSDVAHRRERLDADQVAARLAACERGEGLPAELVEDGHCRNFRVSDRRCGGAEGCGCYLDAKAQAPHWDCPLGLWPKVKRD